MLQNRILIYNDSGARSACVQETFNSLQAFFSHSYTIQLVTADYLNRAAWENNTALIIIPGGRSLPYYQALAAGGNQKIIQFVKNGGNYLGICAGAYYASQTTEFEKGNELEVIAAGPLNFFPGIAAGPANGFNKFQYDNYQGAAIVTVNWLENSENYRVFFQGGCYFLNAENYAKVKVLAHYADLPQKPAAIIQCQVGQGKALLSGVHFEFSYTGINLAEEGGPLLQRELKKIEQQRQVLLQRILTK